MTPYFSMQPPEKRIGWLVLTTLGLAMIGYWLVFRQMPLDFGCRSPWSTLGFNLVSAVSVATLLGWQIINLWRSWVGEPHRLGQRLVTRAGFLTALTPWLLTAVGVVLWVVALILLIWALILRAGDRRNKTDNLVVGILNLAMAAVLLFILLPWYVVLYPFRLNTWDRGPSPALVERQSPWRRLRKCRHY